MKEISHPYHDVLKSLNERLKTGSQDFRMAAEILAGLLSGGRIITDCANVTQALTDTSIPFQQLKDSLNSLFLSQSHDSAILQKPLPEEMLNAVAAQVFYSANPGGIIAYVKEFYSLLIASLPYPVVDGQKALFVDRDGVLIEHVDYIKEARDVQPLKGAVELIRHANRHGIKVFVITNQSGLGRGILTASDYDTVNTELLRVFASHGCYFTEILYAGFFEMTEDFRYLARRNYRKPATGMLLDCARRHQIDLANSFMVGDRATDLAAAVRAQIKNVFLIEGKQFKGEKESFESFLKSQNSPTRFHAVSEPDSIIKLM